MNNCFSIHHTSWITSGPKINFICDNMPTKAILFFFGCSEVNSVWLITSKLANQRARKVQFTCVVYTNLDIYHSQYKDFYVPVSPSHWYYVWLSITQECTDCPHLVDNTNLVKGYYSVPDIKVFNLVNCSLNVNPQTSWPPKKRLQVQGNPQRKQIWNGKLIDWFLYSTSI